MQSNHQKSNIGGIIRTAIITTLTAFLIAVGIGGFVQINQSLPLTTSANATFNETILAGISEPSAVSDEQNNMEVYRTVAPGVVLISTGAGGGGEERGGGGDFYGEPDERSGTGSGVVIDNQGHILTNEHVVRGGRNLTVNLGGDRVYPARLIGADADTDLAVIKIDAPADQLTVVPVGDSDALVVGQKVLAIGNPFGLDRTLTTGVISGLQRPIRARNNRPIEGAIQTDASINPGNSGGPLLDKYGRIIGINSQILSPSGASNGIGFAIPASIVKRIVPQLLRSGRVSRPRLGIAAKSVAELNRQGARLPVENGLLVINVAPGGTAEKAGLRPTTQSYDGRITLGDVITAVDNSPVKTLDELYKAIDGRQIGDSVELEIWRNGEKQKISVRLEAQSNTEDEQPRQPTIKQTRRQRGY